MKLQLLSDLHLECQPDHPITPAPDADLLVLAGDVGSYQDGHLLGDTDDPHWGLNRFSPRLGTWPVPVLYVPGNHEYDGRDFDTTHAQLQARCEALGITWLEQRCLVIAGVRFIGSTLWTDFDALVQPQERPATALKRREKAFRAANWYLRTTGTTRQGEPLLAEGVRTLALEARAWLATALTQAHAGPTVVVTHFAPTLHSLDPRYGLTPGTAGFCNSWDDLLPQAQMWLHGHLHCAHDYHHLGCHVVANPLGYAEKDEQRHWRGQGVWTVPGTAHTPPHHQPLDFTHDTWAKLDAHQALAPPGV